MKIRALFQIVIFSTLFGVLHTVLYGQAYKDFQIKEQYDDVFVGAFDYPPTVNSFGDLSTQTFGQNLTLQGGVLESMLNMYLTTGDKAYLYKFMEWTTEIIALGPFRLYSFVNLNDYIPNNQSNVNFNARLMWPMAHFTYLVKVKYRTELYNTPIYVDAISPINYGNHVTFGEYAEWLYLDIEGRLDWYTGINPNSTVKLWIDSDRGFISKPDDVTTNEQGASAFNFQTPWAMSMAYMFAAKSHPNHKEEYG
ncbi:MAG: hypothetical protein JKY53_01755, partial [Flavobacteriales bacterium]|nr:hypothetical protein [Flavobacteriales bacterium]